MDLYSIDKEIFVFLNGIHFSLLDRVMFFCRDLLLWIPLILLSGFVFIGYSSSKMRPHSLTKMVLFSTFILLQTVLCIAILPHVFDLFIQRVRPAYNDEILQLVNLSYFHFTEREEFYAAKCSTVAAISSFFISFHDTPGWLKAALVLWILLISYNRIYIGAHYPSNILISVILGIIIGMYTYRYHQYLKNSFIVI